MRLNRWMSGIGLGTLAVAGLMLAPAIQAQESRSAKIASRQTPRITSGIGVFTPAAADPKLAAVIARSGLPGTGFRFTPSESRRSSNQAVTVAVRARSNRAAPVADRTNPAPEPVNLAPIAYNLGVSVGWKRFAVSGDLTRIDLVNQPGSRERADFGISYIGKRASGRVAASADRPLTGNSVAPTTPIGDMPSYSIDVGGSYSLTRNLDVTAGVRYKAERDRLPRLTEERRDSQAVYVGTAFRF